MVRIRLGLANQVQNVKNQVNELEKIKNSVPVLFVRKIDDFYINEKDGKKIDLSTISKGTKVIIDDIPSPAPQDEREVVMNEEIE